ncbi:divalent-cation tolerance protein CutA [Streptomyces sp. M2CJ-2]|nr:divalent-cation tolerance protein CutA [Streptomyces sp. M2CJ-2]
MRLSTATPSRGQAVSLAQAVVKTRLAAGSQSIGPVTSVFRHLGEFGEGEEWRLLLTATSERYPERYLLDAHPWDSPELIATPVTGVPRCLDRIRDNVRPEESWAPACSSTFRTAGTFLCRWGDPRGLPDRSPAVQDGLRTPRSCSSPRAAWSQSSEPVLSTASARA